MITQSQTILKLKKIFKLGYIPSRGNESYTEKENGKSVSYYVYPNCLAHACFNLTNQQIKSLDYTDREIFSSFIKTPYYSDKYILRDILRFIKQCGLKTTKCEVSSPLQHNEWKIAIYFGWRNNTKDYHFLLLEKDETWSSKWGFSITVDHFKIPPTKIEHNGYSYHLYGFYKITNPYANNKTPDDNQTELI